MRVRLGVVAMAGAVMLVAAAPVSASPVGCVALGGTVGAGGLCQVQASEPGYTIDMSVPLDYPDERAIVDYLRQTREGFINVAGTPSTSTRQLEMDVTGESLSSGRTRSVVLKLFQDVGSAHPTTWYRSFTYDVATGAPVTFDTLFAPDAKPMDVIFPLVQRELEAETGLAGSISPGDGRDPSHYQNFAITDDSLIFYFGRAELLPSYAGETSVTIPRSELPPLTV